MREFRWAYIFSLAAIILALGCNSGSTPSADTGDNSDGGSSSGGNSNNSGGGSDDDDDGTTNASGSWALLNGPAGDQASAYAITKDADGNLIAVGSTNGDLDGETHAGRAAFITKYDASGTRIWTRLDGQNGKLTEAYAVATDSNSNIFVTGYTTGDLDGNTLQGTQDYFVLEYDKDGNQLWSFQDGSLTTTGRGIAVDSGTNLFWVVGTTTGALNGQTKKGAVDFFLIKFDKTGPNRIRTVQSGVAGFTSHTQGYGIAIDSSHNIYVTGTTDDDLDGEAHHGSEDLFLTRYQSNANRSWTKLDGAIGGITYGAAVAVSSTDDIYVTGYTTVAIDGQAKVGTSNDLIISKYDNTGTLAWTAEDGAPGNMADGKSISIDASGNAYVAGATQGNLDGHTLAGIADMFVTKYTSAGVRSWTVQNGAAGIPSAGYGIVVDGNFSYTCGDTQGALFGKTLHGQTDFFIKQYDSDGG
jgi:hypothetical protein